MKNKVINFAEKLALFDDHWSPRVVAEMNDYQFKLVKVKGDFVFHSHSDTDETFLVLEGVLRIDFEDDYVMINSGEMYVVPKGMQHKPHAQEEVKMLIIEPRGVTNTGDTADIELTAAADQWV